MQLPLCRREIPIFGHRKCRPYSPGGRQLWVWRAEESGDQGGAGTRSSHQEDVWRHQAGLQSISCLCWCRLHAPPPAWTGGGRGLGFNSQCGTFQSLTHCCQALNNYKWSGDSRGVWPCVTTLRYQLCQLQTCSHPAFSPPPHFPLRHACIVLVELTETRISIKTNYCWHIFGLLFVIENQWIAG